MTNMSAPERRLERGHVSRPEAVPNLTGRPVEQSKNLEASGRFPSSKLFPDPKETAQRSSKSPEVPVRQSQTPRPTAEDAYKYLSKLIKKGVLTQEQVLEIMGQSDENRQKTVEFFRNQERQQEAQFRHLGIYEEAQRLEQIKEQIPNEIIPIDNGYREFNRRPFWPILPPFGIGGKETPHREWRHRGDLAPLTTGQKIGDFFIKPLHIFNQGAERVDVVFVDNPDGSQTKYVDRATRWFHRGGFVADFLGGGMDLIPREFGVYKETYSPKDKKGKRKLMGREKAGDIIDIGGWIEDEEGLPKREYSVITDKLRPLEEERQRIEMHMNEKGQEYYFSEVVNMGGTGYEPTEKEKKVRKRLEDGVSKMLWSVKDTPAERRKFLIKNIATTTTYAAAFTILKPLLGALPFPFNIGASIALGAGLGFGGQYAMYNRQDVWKYMKEHPIATALQILPTVGMFINPFIGGGLIAALLVGQVAIPSLIKWKAERGLAGKFKEDHPELKNRKERRRAFKKELPFLMQQKMINEFVTKNIDWFEQLKRLNPGVPEDAIKEAMIMRTGTGEFTGKFKELQAIQQELLTKNMLVVGMPRVFIMEGASLFAPLAGALGGTLGSLIGLPPVLGSAMGQLAMSGLVSIPATTLQVDLIRQSLNGTKQKIVKKYPELIPELRREGITNGTS